VTDHRSGKFKGCGFIEFETEEACINAVKMNGTMLLGRNIRVDFSSDKPSRDHRDYEGRARGEEEQEEKREEDNEENKNENKAEDGVEGSDQQKDSSVAPSSLSSFLGQLSGGNASSGDGGEQVTGENGSTSSVNDGTQPEASQQQAQASAVPTLPAGITPEMLAAMIANAQRVQQEQQQQAQQAEQQQQQQQQQPSEEAAAAAQEPFGGY